MRTLLSVAVVVAIAISACQSVLKNQTGLKDQIKGRWLEEPGMDTPIECIDEYLEKYRISNCKDGAKILYSGSINYEIADDNFIVFTSDKGVKTVVGVKINGDEMQVQNIDRDKWVKFVKMK